MPAYRVNGKFVSKEVYENFHKLQQEEQERTQETMNNQVEEVVEQVTDQVDSTEDMNNQVEEQVEEEIQDQVDQVEEETPKKRGRKRTGSSMPELTCLISGQSRRTTWEYLNAKAERHRVMAKYLIDNYICKNICSVLRKGTPLSELTDSTISDEKLKELVVLNSKARVEFEFVDGVYRELKATTTEKSEKSPKAPKVVDVKSKIKAMSDDTPLTTSSMEEYKDEEVVDEDVDEVLEELNSLSHSNPF